MKYKVSNFIISLFLAAFGILAFVFIKGWGLIFFVFVTAFVRKIEMLFKSHTQIKIFDMILVTSFLISCFCIYFALLFSNFMSNFKPELEAIHNLGTVTSLQDQIYSVSIDDVPPHSNISSLPADRIRRGISVAKNNPVRMDALYGTFIIGWISYIILHSFTRLYRQRSAQSIYEVWMKGIKNTPDPRDKQKNGRRAFLIALFLFFILFIWGFATEASDLRVARTIIRSSLRTVLDIEIGGVFLWLLDRAIISHFSENQRL